MTQVLFLTIGSIGGALAVLLWPVHPLLIIIASALLYGVGLFVWERIARRIIGSPL